MYCLTPNLSHVFKELLSVYLFVFGNIVRGQVKGGHPRLTSVRLTGNSDRKED